MQGCESGGAMVSISASEGAVGEVLASEQGRIAIAGRNGPEQTVISGDEATVLRVAALFDEQGVKTTRLVVSHAFHSPHMDSMLDEFRAIAESCSFHPPQIPVMSNVTGPG